jgi:hypothetical protein
MDTPDEDPKPLSPIKAICRLVICSALAIYFLWTGIADLISGATVPMTRYGDKHIIMRQDAPEAFWFWIIAHFAFAVLMLFLAPAKWTRRQ